MAAAIHTEERFEDEICAHLLANGWLFDGVLPYEKSCVYDAGYDKRLGLYPADAIAWVKETQPETWAKFAKNHTQNPEGVFIKRLAEELDQVRHTIKREKPQLWGSLYVLRNGFKDIGATFRMAQFAPANQQNQQTWQHYKQNKLRVVRQLHYSLHNQKCIDLVLFLNGIPLATIELKTDTTQNINDAIKQYKYDRPPQDPISRQYEPLLSFGKRALVHFAVSCDEVQMTTKLNGAATRFLPLNRGIPDGSGGAGAGNAPDSKLGYATGYLWHEVFQRDALLGIVGKFLAVQVTARKGERGKTEYVPSLLFPRYHQWLAVKKLLSATLAEGVGQTYLVQHSAGSGKSNTIAWLAHHLASLHDANDQKMYSSVIVVTDRRVLDQQLQDTIEQFDHQAGVVQKIDENSTQLAEALMDGKHIIITTLQKFPWVLSKAEGLKDKCFALIIDEAHSSQSGSSAVKLREVLTSDGKPPALEARFTNEQDYAEEVAMEMTAEDVLNQVIASRMRPPNVSYYAFTATPKPKTLELFGRVGAAGLPEPFDVYSMRQAIEEGFILDVLKGYTSYDFAFKLEQEADDKEVKAGRAKTKLFRYAQWHPTSIAQKVAVIVEHFRQHVMHLLNDQAKAMIVADGRIAAVRYKKAIDAYIAQNNYHDCKALVAFSGTVTDPESGIVKAHEGNLNANGERDDTIKDAFSSSDYQLLIVASKFQTGFDQPLLCAMYLDKRIDGVLAVQTLSRLNRTYPGKEKTLVLDFRNNPKDILKSFMPYYRTAELSEVTDRNLVHKLRDKLDATRIYLWEEVEVFAKAYFDPKGKQAAIQHPLKQAHERFMALKKEEQDLFRGDLSSYVSAYDFLSQLVDYEDYKVELEKLHAFAKSLLPRLRGKDDGDNLDGAVRLAGYKVINPISHNLSLEDGESTQLKPMGTGGGEPWDDPSDRLSAIIKKMNELFAGNHTDADFAGYATHLIGKMAEDDTLREQANANNTPEAFSNGAYETKLVQAVIGALESHSDMADQALKNTEVFKGLSNLLLNDIYEKLRQKAEV